MQEIRVTISGMPLLNYTTKIRADRTVDQIRSLLAAKGARRVTTDYDHGKITAVIFTLDVSGHPIEFRLPAKPDGVLAALKKQRVARTLLTPEHAESVAWRIVKDWIEAQLALVEAEQAVMAEVFLPYAQDSKGRSVFAAFEQKIARGLLTAGDVPE